MTAPHDPQLTSARWTERVKAVARPVRDIARHYRVVTIRDGPAKGKRIGLRYASNDYRHGKVEMPVQRAIAGLMKPGGVFYDVGANVGFFTLIAASAVGGDGTFVAFEPRPDVADALEANMRRNDIEASIWRVAVGDEDGTVSLLVAEHPGGATIEPSAASDTESVLVVEQVTIDHLVQNGHIPAPDLVKIDVEGAEPAALRGMAETLRLGGTTVVYEIDASSSGVAEANYVEVEAILRSCGLTSTRLEQSYADSGWHVIHSVARPETAG